MEYQVGRMGRTVVAAAGAGEDIYPAIEAIAAREKIASAVVLLLGGLRTAKVVVGPKNPNGPIEPQFREFNDAREIVGVGTLFLDEGKPMLHLHGAIGRGEEAIVGCPRGGPAKAFCTLEVVILELEGIDASRRLDPAFGMKLLTLGR